MGHLKQRLANYSLESARILRSLLTTNPFFSIRQFKTYPSWHKREEEFLDFCIRSDHSFDISVDLGCGPHPRNFFSAQSCLGVDIYPYDGVHLADLAIDKLPFETSSIDAITAFDLIEHIPRQVISNQSSIYPFVTLMSEIHRVLKPGGLFYHRTPAYPSKEAFQDPTHTNIITEDTFPRYFCRPLPYAKNYGFVGEFELIKQSWIKSSHLIGLMKAIK